jgi:hypothetical protein
MILSLADNFLDGLIHKAGPPVVERLVDLSLGGELSSFRLGVDTGDNRVGNVRASVFLLDSVSRFVSGFSADNSLALCAFSDVVVQHVFLGS